MQKWMIGLVALALATASPSAEAGPRDSLRNRLSLSVAYAGAGTGYIIGGVVGQALDLYGEDQITEIMVGGLAAASLGAALSGSITYTAMGGRGGWHLLTCGLVGTAGTALAIRAGRFQDLYDPEPPFVRNLALSAGIAFIAVPVTSLIAAVALGEREEVALSLVPWTRQDTRGVSLALRW